MKITHLIYSFTFGGAETMLIDIANHQVKKAKIDIIIINNFYNEALFSKISNQVKVHFINRKVGTKNPIPIIRLNMLLFKLSPNIIHCHNHDIIPLLLPSFKKKAVLTLHNMGVITKYLNKYHQLFAISNSVKKDLLARAQIDSIVIYNGISTFLIKTKKAIKIESIFKIISVGRFEHLIKGQHLAIEALHLLNDRGVKNIHLDFIGSGTSEQFLKELTIKYSLTNQISFLGLKDRDYIYSHLKDYDLLIQPSLFEGFGLTVAEGMAAKVPVLVSDIDGPMEIIENGKYGYAFKSGNIEDIAKQLQYILSNYSSDEFKQKIEAAYYHVKENFEIAQTSKSYIENYL